MSDSFLRRTWVEVDLDAIASNFREVKQKAPGAKIMAVVKADAYGHGVEQVSRALAQAGADWFGVSNFEEALQLRALGHTLPIPDFGVRYTPPQEVKALCQHRISQAVYSDEYAAASSQAAVVAGVTVDIHLKLDVGTQPNRVSHVRRRPCTRAGRLPPARFSHRGGIYPLPVGRFQR